MKLSRYLLCCFTVATIGVVTTTKAEELTQDRYRELISELKPDSNELWRTIPWETSVLSAQELAAKDRKPIFIWAMDGHPLGCT